MAKRLLIGFGIALGGYVLLVLLKIASVRIFQEGFVLRDVSPTIYFTYRSWRGCKHCNSFEPVWDSFVKKAAGFFRAAKVIPQKMPPSNSTKPRSMGSPDYPEVEFFNTGDPHNPTRFRGPYTDQGLKVFVQQFQRTHPPRA